MTPYYQDASVTLYHGDCREILPSLRSVDLVLTDPPFEAEAHTLQRRVQHQKGVGHSGLVVTMEPLPFEPISVDTRELVAHQVVMLAKRWVLTFCQVEAAPIWRAVYESHGLSYRRTCIWVKPDGMPQYSGDRPAMGYETILAMHTKGRSDWNGGGRSSVFVHNKNSGGPHEHPTMKPEPLMAQLVALFSNPSELVLDPFAGSGTTLRAAKDLGRRAIGIEIEERYCEIAAKRCSQEVLPFGTPDAVPLTGDTNPR